MAIEWDDIGIIISSRHYGESDIILHVLTQYHGAHYGLVKGGASRKRRAEFQIGNLINLKWKARILDNLGTYTCNLEYSFSANFLDNSIIILQILTLCSVANTVLTERECCDYIFTQAYHLLKNLDDNYWVSHYAKWELNILSHLGFGLSLDKCALTGIKEGLVYVSPKSGRAVSKKIGQPYSKKLLTLPSFLYNENINQPSVKDMIYAMDLTEYFLLRHVYESNINKIPNARKRLRTNMIEKLESN